MKNSLILKVLMLIVFSSSVYAKDASCATQRKVFIDQDDVKVWRTTICPNERLAFHTHDHARIAISNVSGILEVISQDGGVKRIEFTKGVPVYLSLEQGQSPHQDVNVGQYPMDITIVELLSHKQRISCFS